MTCCDRSGATRALPRVCDFAPRELEERHAYSYPSPPTVLAEVAEEKALTDTGRIMQPTHEICSFPRGGSARPEATAAAVKGVDRRLRARFEYANIRASRAARSRVPEHRAPTCTRNPRMATLRSALLVALVAAAATALGQAY